MAAAFDTYEITTVKNGEAEAGKEEDLAFALPLNLSDIRHREKPGITIIYTRTDETSFARFIPEPALSYRPGEDYIRDCRLMNIYCHNKISVKYRSVSDRRNITSEFEGFMSNYEKNPICLGEKLEVLVLWSDKPDD